MDFSGGGAAQGGLLFAGDVGEGMALCLRGKADFYQPLA
jgi:hypothetical protein